MSKKFLEQMQESLFFLLRKKVLGNSRNPEIRELIDDFNQKKRNEFNKTQEREDKNISKLQNSYEYKVFEHYKKVDFLSSKRYSADFLKYCKFDIYYDRTKWLSSNFIPFIRHYYTPRDFIRGKYFYLFLFLSILLFFKMGYYSGYKDSILYDVIANNIIDIRTEDQLFDLILRYQQPVFVLYYIPGILNNLDMMFAMGDFTEKYGNGIVTMAKVNCKYNLDLCMKKSPSLLFSQWELMLNPFNDPSDGQRKFPVVPCKYDSSFEGIEGFLMQQGIMEDKYNPIGIINNSMRKY
jgi:hypothetical protein